MLDLRLPNFYAAGAIPPFMTEVVALIVAGAIIAYICFRLRLCRLSVF